MEKRSESTAQAMRDKNSQKLTEAQKNLIEFLDQLEVGKSLTIKDNSKTETIIKEGGGYKISGDIIVFNHAGLKKDFVDLNTLKEKLKEPGTFTAAKKESLIESIDSAMKECNPELYEKVKNTPKPIVKNQEGKKQNKNAECGCNIF